MGTYILGFSESGVPIVNGDPAPQYGTSGGSPMHTNDNVPFTLIPTQTRDGTELRIVNAMDSDPIRIVLEPSALEYMQRNEALIVNSMQNPFSVVLNNEATQSITASDLRMSNSGNSIIIGGEHGDAYFNQITFQRDGGEIVMRASMFKDAEPLPPTAALQSQFVLKVQSEQPRGGSHDVPDVRPPEESLLRN